MRIAPGPDLCETVHAQTTPSRTFDDCRLLQARTAHAISHEEDPSAVREESHGF
jgi:hypothetical protein